MTTKAQLMGRIVHMHDSEVIAVPVLWTKAAAENLWEYAHDKELTLTKEQWESIVERYEHAEFYGDDAMLETIEEVLAEDE